MTIRKAILVPVLIALPLVVVGCANGSYSVDPKRQGSDTPYSVKDDAALENTIRRKLFSDSTLADARLDIRVEQGKVTINGTVDQRRDADRIERIAKGTEGVRGVSIRVRETKGY